MIKNLYSIYVKYTPFQWLCIYVFLLLLVKLFLLPIVHPIDADGISRVYASLQWAENPFIIKTGNWPPLHFYLVGTALKVYNNPFYTPLLVNVFLSLFTLFPLYFLIRRLFNERTALLMILIFSLSPIVFRLSLLALAETPAIFFMVSGASILAKGIIENKNRYIIGAGLLITIAGGFRYESWIIAPLVTLIIAWRFSLKQALLFMLPALLFPLYWLTSNYFESDNMFSSFTWAAEAVETNKINSLDAFLRRIWFYPLSLVFAFGPFAFYFFIKELVKVVKSRKQNKNAYWFFVLFLAVFMFFLINCLRGSLLTQHRFTVTLYLLSFPFLGYYFSELTKHTFRNALLFSISAFFLAFGYSSKGARPIPRLLKKEAVVVNDAMHKDMTDESGLIIDYWDWETTYYLAFMTRLHQQNMVILDQNSNVDEALTRVESVIDKHPTGFITICTNGKLINEVTINGNIIGFKKSNRQIIVKSLYENKEIRVYKYHL